MTLLQYFKQNNGGKDSKEEGECMGVGGWECGSAHAYKCISD